MDEKILAYLTKEKVGCLTTLLKNGAPHAATLHFSHQSDPVELYFSTEKTSRKCEGLLNGEMVLAAFVVGFSETEWVTLQMEGEVTVVTDLGELERVRKIHYAKHPGSEKYKDDPATIFLKFIPKWYRLTDYNTKPTTIIASDN